jgi:ketol-acid reductoisomerase
MTVPLFRSEVFDVEEIELSGTDEQFVRGGRDRFAQLAPALDGIRRIGVIGWGSQGPAQAQNLRESLAGTDIQVTVGLRSGSSALVDARAAGFNEDDGTLGEMFEVISSSDLVILLISDAAQAQLYPRIFEALRPGSTLGLSHGFLLGHLANQGEDFPDHVNVIAVCPKGMGPSVRRLYEQGRDVNGAGINASFAVHQDVTSQATDLALAWAVALGAPYTFRTTLESEYRSDIFGERAILLGAVHGMVEALYRRLVESGVDPVTAFNRTADNVTGSIARTISGKGLLAVREALEPDGRERFDRAYDVTYDVMVPLLAEIYDEVASGNEIRSVILAGQRLERFPLTTIDGSPMWQAGAEARARRDTLDTAIDPITAGVFCATMMAQVDVLVERGHPWSEVANESIIEAVDSLYPYMHARGVAYMVDNCSTTARLGARKWGPRFDALLSQVAFPLIDGDDTGAPAGGASRSFGDHPVHRTLEALAATRPPVDIAVE